MLITNIETNTPVKIKYICSPAVEMVSSLHVLADPEHHPECITWSQYTQRKMSRELKRDLSLFSDNYNQWALIMDLVNSIETKNTHSMEDFFKQLINLDVTEFAYWFLSGLIDINRVRELLLSPETICQDDLIEIKYFITEDNVIYFLKNASEIQIKLTKVLKDYWNEIFEETWRGIEAYEYSRMKFENEVLLHTNNWKEYLLKCHDSIEITDSEIILKKQTDYHVEISKLSEIIFIPSMYTNPHLMMSLHGNVLTVYKDIDFRMSQCLFIDESLQTFLKAIDSEKRLKILHSISKDKRTTKEIADLLNLPQSSVSESLKILHNANLVCSSKKHGGVWYEMLTDNYHLNIKSMGELFGK